MIPGVGAGGGGEATTIVQEADGGGAGGMFRKLGMGRQYGRRDEDVETEEGQLPLPAPVLLYRTEDNTDSTPATTTTAGGFTSTH
ncbi:hypothetical protein VKT23_020276 [Stygiomarasmius scandens]|uniref:Uncharacterized protein n=1 Tax=Marasmiellus scandens TaxID=2682957 RepID=A0ABR1IJC8_9AGAR